MSELGYLADERVVVANEDIQMRVSSAPSDPQWDDFVARTPNGNHVQTSLWAQVKSLLGWEAVRVILSHEDRILAGAQILAHSVFPLVKIGYVTKGPVCAVKDAGLAQRMIQEIIRLSRQMRLQYLIVQPPMGSEDIAGLLQERGFRATSVEAGPTATILVDTTQDVDQMLSRMKRQNRQNIRRSEREGISVREGSREDLDTFYELHLISSKRQDFLPYTREYFYRMWDVLAPCGNIGLILTEKDGQAVSGLLIVPFGDTVIAKLFGWSGQYGECRPNEALFWGAILWTKAHGYRYFDFEGIDREGARAVLNGEPLPEPLLHTYTFFKLQFGGEVTLLPLAYEYIQNPLLAWGYYQVAPKIMKSKAFTWVLDRIRKRTAG
jgi:lipid II:glycine glycyltransferase (peptidoglycan interpeptide bridge formation enzyme)